MVYENWSTEESFRHWHNRISKRMCLDIAKNLDLRHQHENEFTDEVLEECYRISASLLTQYGDLHLLIFERLDNEIELRKQRKALIANIFNVSKDICCNAVLNRKDVI